HDPLFVILRYQIGREPVPLKKQLAETLQLRLGRGDVGADAQQVRDHRVPVLAGDRRADVRPLLAFEQFGGGAEFGRGGRRPTPYGISGSAPARSSGGRAATCVAPRRARRARSPFVLVASTAPGTIAEPRPRSRARALALTRATAKARATLAASAPPLTRTTAGAGSIGGASASCFARTTREPRAGALDR